MKIFRPFLALLLISASFIQAGAQHPEFWNDIQAFKKQDSLQPPPAHPIVFIGSSTFTRWQQVQKDFPGYTIVNRGFGGSSFPDLRRYLDDIVFKYDPKQVVVYCGDNDLAGSDTIQASTVVDRFKELFTLIRVHNPRVPIAFVSIKPSPSRWQLKDKAISANQSIRNWLRKQKRASYIDTWTPMLGPDGKPDETIFVEDKLHMNEKGYEIWKKAIEPYLLK